jgi:hypothetical protein
MCADGQIIPNMVYELRGTPCADVVQARACYYEAGIQELFPDDAMIRDLGMQSYLATPLMNETGKTLGLVAVLNRHPMAAHITEAPLTLSDFGAGRRQRPLVSPRGRDSA